MRLIDRIGTFFGRLKITAIISGAVVKNGRFLQQPILAATCECGTEGEYRYDSLMRGGTTSCGCYNMECIKERFYKHGHAGPPPTPIYKTWKNMLQHHGDNVCAYWKKDFVNFLNDIGDKPENTHLNRINRKLGYNKLNCEWRQNG